MDIYDLHPDNVVEWLDSGRSAELPAEAIIYLEQLEIVRSMYSKYESQQLILNTLMNIYPGMYRQRAVQLYTDSLNFFYANNDVKKEAWRNIYAEKFELAARAAWEMNQFETFRRCLVSAMEARGLKNQDKDAIPADILDRRIVIYQMDPRKVGLEKANRNELAAFIDKLELNDKEKIKLRQDAGIIDVDFLEESHAEDHSQ
jgi:hypothetical protein